MSHFLWIRIWEWCSQGILAQGFSRRLQARSRWSESLRGSLLLLLAGGLSSWPHGPSYRATWVSQTWLSWVSKPSKGGRRKLRPFMSESQKPHAVVSSTFYLSEVSPCSWHSREGLRLFLWREGRWRTCVHNLKPLQPPWDVTFTALLTCLCIHLSISPFIEYVFHECLLGMSTVAGARAMTGEADMEVIPPFFTLPKLISGCY